MFFVPAGGIPFCVSQKVKTSHQIYILPNIILPLDLSSIQFKTKNCPRLVWFKAKGFSFNGSFTVNSSVIMKYAVGDPDAFFAWAREIQRPEAAEAVTDPAAASREKLA